MHACTHHPPRPGTDTVRWSLVFMHLLQDVLLTDPTMPCKLWIPSCCWSETLFMLKGCLAALRLPHRAVTVRCGGCCCLTGPGQSSPCQLRCCCLSACGGCCARFQTCACGRRQRLLQGTGRPAEGNAGGCAEAGSCRATGARTRAPPPPLQGCWSRWKPSQALQPAHGAQAPQMPGLGSAGAQGRFPAPHWGI